MKAWSASAIKHYYFDPEVVFLKVTDRDPRTARKAGYYIVPHCDPDCCQAFGGVATGDLGPFSTRLKARRWSCKNLVENGGLAPH